MSEEKRIQDNTDETPPVRVFISYSHDNEEHKANVLKLANQLREDGLDCHIDQFEPFPKETWPIWMKRQIRDARFVLMVCTPLYRQRFDQELNEEDKGFGVAWEGAIINQSIYNKHGKNSKFIPVYFSHEDRKEIPDLLDGFTCYQVSDQNEYIKLYRYLTDQPEIEKNPLGTLKKLPTRSSSKLFETKPDHPGAPESLDKPKNEKPDYPRYWTVPNSNPLFTGRGEVLSAIHDYFNKHQSLAITQAIKGLGGIGKTQAAIEYAHRFHADYAAVLWIRAEKQEDWKSSLAEFARQYKLASAEMKEDEQTQAARAWLQQNNGWLLILDNLEDLSQVEQILPRPCFGRILVTTRQTALGRLHGVSLECMDDDTGALFLLRRIGAITEEEGLDNATLQKQNDAKDISRELGGLPLALDQAGAYITETGCGLQGYLKRYQDNSKLLLAKRGADGKDDHLHSVDTTFALCFEKLQKENPAVELFLQMCAFMAPEAIPEEIFSSQDAFKDDMAFDQCIADCAKYSLLKRDGENHILSLHRLTQVVLRERLEEDKRKEMAEKCVLALAKVFPAVEFESWPQCRRLLPHAMTIAGWIEEYSIEIEEVGYLCNQIAYFLKVQGRYAETETLYKKAIWIVEKIFGEEHPNLATCYNNLASLYYSQGRYEEAEPLYKKAIAIGEKALGLEHPELAKWYNNLALLYHDQGRYEEAVLLYRKAIVIGEKTLGFEHPDLATWYNNLAGLHYSQSRYEEAEPLYLKAIEIDENALGLEHPGLAADYNNLAGLYYNQSRYEEAEPLYLKAIEIDENALGLEHPGLAADYNNLAGLYYNQSRYEEAEPLLIKAIAIIEKVLPKDHPQLATHYSNYSLLLQETGREEEAKVYLGKAEEIRRMREMKGSG